MMKADKQSCSSAALRIGRPLLSIWYGSWARLTFTEECVNPWRVIEPALRGYEQSQSSSEFDFRPLARRHLQFCGISLPTALQEQHRYEAPQSLALTFAFRFPTTRPQLSPHKGLVLAEAVKTLAPRTAPTGGQSRQADWSETYRAGGRNGPTPCRAGNNLTISHRRPFSGTITTVTAAYTPSSHRPEYRSRSTAPVSYIVIGGRPGERAS
ncbi:hypothetical protein GE09DRAFT_157337 [Coniochaeta sp. 2T2.1]|nr:hypothetical protein GE09DRAFT_157337 [Coniochaeta sp. 2T2.1]